MVIKKQLQVTNYAARLEEDKWRNPEVTNKSGGTTARSD